MKHFIAVTTSGTGTVHTLMTAEALEKVAASLQRRLGAETNGQHSSMLSIEEIAAADVVIFASDVRVERARFAKALIEAAVELAGMDGDQRPSIAPDMGAKKFVAVTVSPGNINHTFITAASLRKAARALGHEIKIEIQDPLRVTGELTPKEIAAADAVLIAAETSVDTSRFLGKPIYFTNTKQVVEAGQEVLTKMLTQSTIKVEEFPLKKEQTKQIRVTTCAPYKHLLTGISYMLPMLTVGGLATALAVTFSNIYTGEQKEGSLEWALHLIGSGTAFQLLMAIFSGYIAFSIADRPALVPGFIGGMLAQHFGAGFLGGIAAGFLAGYLTTGLTDAIHLPEMFKGLKASLILPLLSSLLLGLIMIYLVAPPVGIILDSLTGWLCGMQRVNALMLGLLLGGMMAFDMGGPVNKSALTFAVGLLTSKIYTPMAAVMIAGMTPPLGLAIAAWLFKNRFDKEERETALPTFILGLSFITESAIPFALKDPLRVMPALLAGSATSGAITMAYHVELMVPHGGIFSILIPGAVKYLEIFLIALLCGILVTVALLFFLKSPVNIPRPTVAEPH